MWSIAKLPGIAVAVPVLAGSLAASRLAPRPLLTVALLGLGLGLGGRSGNALALAAAALLLAWSRPGPATEPPAWLDPARPVAVRAELKRPWQATRWGWSSELAVATVRQGQNAAAWPRRLAIDLGSPPAPARGWLTARGVLRRAPPLWNDPPLAPGPWRLRVKSARLLHAAPDNRRQHLDPMAPRRRVGALFERSPPSPGRELARALVLGDVAKLDRDLLRGLRRLGLGHLLAVSGLHVGLAAWILWWLAGPLPRPLRRAAPILGAAGYLLLVGPRPAVLRAAVMAMLAARALASERAPHTLNALGWGLAGVLVLEPAAAGELGFALTAAATGGIVVLAPMIESRWHWLPRGLRRALAASTGAQLAALPWTLSRFHVVTPLTVPLNLIAVPWTALTLAASFVWLGLASARPVAGERAQTVLDLLAAPYQWPAALSPRAALLTMAGCGWWSALIVTLGVAAALLAPHRGWRALGVAVAVALLLLPRPGRGLEVVMLDVGQGESLLLRDGRRAALVDGGGWQRLDIAQRVLVPSLARRGVRRLDAVILTHPDLDHCRGLVDLTAYLPVREVWSATGLEPAGCGGDLRAAVERWRPLWAGRRLELGRWSLAVLHPPAGSRGDGNDRSLVLRAVAGERAILLTGDVERRGESAILRRGGPGGVRSAVLKVAHHGSASSTSPAFLAAVAPRLALISAGRGNRYGHPSPRVLARLEEGGEAVLRTDRRGMVRLPWPSLPPTAAGRQRAIAKGGPG